MLKYSTIFIVAILSTAITATANAKPRHARYRGDRVGPAQIICNERGCSDNRGAASRAIDANGNEDGVVIGGRPSECPHAFCGCEASRYIFGHVRAELNLASNWLRKFPRTSPAPGMAAVRNHHVMVLISHVDGNDWLVHDGNSGGGLTREHVRSISGYAIVNPQGA